MTTQPSNITTSPPDRRRGGLMNHELYWRERQAWLAEQGYMLRPRYQPDWRPSWYATGRFFFDCEDGHAADVSLGSTIFPRSELTQALRYLCGA